MGILSFKSKEEKQEKEKPVIYDFRSDVVKLPNGEVIPRGNILHVDPKENIVVYIDSNREIKKVKF